MSSFDIEKIKGKSQREIFDYFYSEGAYKNMYVPGHIASHIHKSAKYIVGFIPDKTIKILEIGSGIGNLIKILYDQGYKNIVGSDISEVAIRMAEHKERMVACEAKSLPFADGEFDMAVSIGTYEHIPPKDIDASFKELLRVARSAILFIDKGGTDPTHYTNEVEEYWAEKIKKAAGIKVRIDENFRGGSDTRPLLVNL